MAKSEPKISLVLGRAYPRPQRLATNSSFQNTLKAFDDAVKREIHDANAEEHGSYSLSMFSASDADLIYERHHTSQIVANSKAGTNKVDRDSMYRICSITKLFTVYTFLIEAGDRHLNDPVIDYVPELFDIKRDGDLALTSWEDVTLEQLACHLSGMARDFGIHDFAVDQHGAMPQERYPRLHSALPPLTDAEKPPCGFVTQSGSFVTCDASSLLSGIATSAAIFPTSYTATYCNSGYVLFALALERMKGVSFEDMFVRSLVEPLKLNHTTYSTPPEARWSSGVIPGDTTASGWDSTLGPFSPAGANYMSLQDLSTLGRSILRSDLLSRAQTRRWMKPKSHTADLSVSVGMPWEIERVEVHGRTVDLYTKDGDWHLYHTHLILVPEYDIGFAMLTASDSTSAKGKAGLKVISTFKQQLIEIVLPSLETLGKAEAEKAFAGSYASSSNSITHAITIGTDSHSGLKVAKWEYNGTDILQELGRPFSGIDLRLQPNELYEEKRVGFSGVFSNYPWENVSLFRYGKVDIGQFVFEVGDNGTATSVTSMALRSDLPRV